ncbi:lipopolysaccharide biosynthesis protein [Robiginitalea sp. IMCC44478]|uniref:lipopolysaccharide biosynthesis protein n=1 Tax=Robiginitalea sp. IMCC44478 TaxID=3459122 RepID=UPI0040420ABA
MMSIQNKHIASRIPFILSFLFTKGIVFFTPLLLADLLDQEVFGKLEYALAGLGFVLNAFINLGVPGGYPYFLLREKGVEVRKGFALHLVWLASLFFCNQLAFFVFGLQAEWYMSFNVAFIIANQVFYSTRLKSHERSTMAIYFDSGIYLLLLVLFLLFYFQLLPVSLETINYVLLGYASVYMVAGLRSFIYTNKQAIFSQYRRILKYSLNVMLGTFLIFLLTASGRILVEYFFSYEEVGVYAYYFRISAVSVMVYQMVAILYFRKLYTFPPKLLDRYYSWFFIMMGVLSLSVFYIAPYILNEFSVFFSNTYQDYKDVYFLLCFQMVMWIATALNSSIIDRENLAKKNNLWFLLLIIAGLIVLFFLKGSLTTFLLVFVHMSVIFLAALIQYRTLKTKGILFKKSILALTTLYAIAAIWFFSVL